MATYGEMVYMCLDLLKERADDSYYTEEHIQFLLDKVRVYLLEQKYGKSRNKSFSAVSDENVQHICIPLEKADSLAGSCGSQLLKSVNKVPSTLDMYSPKVNAPTDVFFSAVNWIPVERIPYVGHNKWLKHILYAAKSNDGYLYLTGQGQNFMFLQQVSMDAVFADSLAAAELSCDNNGGDGTCNALEMKFPLESGLIALCVETVVQEIVGSRYAPEDKSNDAKDGLGEIGVTKNVAPLNKQQRRREMRDTEE